MANDDETSVLGLNLKVNADTTVTSDYGIERYTYALIGKEEQSQEEKARRENGKIGRRNLSFAERNPAFYFVSRSILGRFLHPISCAYQLLRLATSIREQLRMNFAGGCPVIPWLLANDHCCGFTGDAYFLQNPRDSFNNSLFVFRGYARPNG